MRRTTSKPPRRIAADATTELRERIAELEKENDGLRKMLAERDDALFHIREYVSARAAPPYLPPRTRSKDEAQRLVDALAARRLRTSVAGQRLRDALSRSQGRRSQEVARMIEALLESHRGNLTSVALDMETSRSQLHRLCKRHGVDLTARQGPRDRRRQKQEPS